jgi:hypothetical protein
MYRRICLFGGPGVSKSTLAAYIFSQLKMEGYEIECAREYIKNWAYIGRAPQSYDQVYIFGKQMHCEDLILRNGKSAIITDSPLFLSTCYAWKHKSPGYQHLIEIAKEFDQTFPAINIFVERGDLPYNPVARFQSYEQALEVDRFVKEMMDLHKVPYESVLYSNKGRFLELSRQIGK